MLDMISAWPDATGCAKAAVLAIKRPADIAIRFFIVVPFGLWRELAFQPVRTKRLTRRESKFDRGEHFSARHVGRRATLVEMARPFRISGQSVMFNVRQDSCQATRTR